MGRSGAVRHAAALIAAVLAAPAAAKDPPIEATFPGLTAAQVSDRIALACAEREWGIEERTERAVVCTDTFPAFMSSAQNKQLMRFNLFDMGDRIEVRGQTRILTTNGFGQVRESEGIDAERMLALLKAVAEQ